MDPHNIRPTQHRLLVVSCDSEFGDWIDTNINKEKRAYQMSQGDSKKLEGDAPSASSSDGWKERIIVPTILAGSTSLKRKKKFTFKVLFVLNDIHPYCFVTGQVLLVEYLGCCQSTGKYTGLLIFQLLMPLTYPLSLLAIAVCSFLFLWVSDSLLVVVIVDWFTQLGSFVSPPV